jgi:hypothetical protein
MKIIASIEDPVVINKILAHLSDTVASVQTCVSPQCRAPPAARLFD